jgi:hypothetical protein
MVMDIKKEARSRAFGRSSELFGQPPGLLRHI